MFANDVLVGFLISQSMQVPDLDCFLLVTGVVCWLLRGMAIMDIMTIVSADKAMKLTTQRL